MMEAAADDDEIFVYMGGDQQVPDGVRRARIHEDVKIIRSEAFYNRETLIYVEFHDGIEVIEKWAFYRCLKLRIATLRGVKIIGDYAFCGAGLTDFEFGDKLETIGQGAFQRCGHRVFSHIDSSGHAVFNRCNPFKNCKIPSVRYIGVNAFAYNEISDVEFGEDLGTIREYAFDDCSKLKQIALPLKGGGMIERDAFDRCPELKTVDLVGGLHNTVASLHMESWRKEMRNEINRINQILPTLIGSKTEEIQKWIVLVTQQLDHYKNEHHQLLKEATTLLELALWKAKVDDEEGDQLVNEGVRITRGSRKRAREEKCVTCGADVVIKNVLPFLALK